MSNAAATVSTTTTTTRAKALPRKLPRTAVALTQTIAEEGPTQRFAEALAEQLGCDVVYRPLLTPSGERTLWWQVFVPKKFEAMANLFYAGWRGGQRDIRYGEPGYLELTQSAYAPAGV